MCFRYERDAIVGRGVCVCVRAEKHSERWACATLPLAPSAAHHLAYGILAAKHFQTELLGDATAHDRGSVDPQLRHRESMRAYRALANLIHFLGTIMLGHVAILRVPVDVMLHTAEEELSIL